MNDHSNEQNATNGSAQPPGQAPPTPAPSARCVFEPICDAFRKGAQDAKQAAEQAAPKVKAAAADALYWLAYGVAFTAGFHYHLARQLAPEPLKTGCRDGIKASQDAAARFADWWKRTTPEPMRAEAAPATPEAPQPGVA